jgi:hypothetical protein
MKHSKSHRTIKPTYIVQKNLLLSNPEEKKAMPTPQHYFPHRGLEQNRK